MEGGLTFRSMLLMDVVHCPNSLPKGTRVVSWPLNAMLGRGCCGSFDRSLESMLRAATTAHAALEIITSAEVVEPKPHYAHCRAGACSKCV